ncbi:MAG: class I SAM-dependent methyltransferase [Armatimonadota bacterium]
MDVTKRQITEVFNRAAETYERVGPKFFAHFGKRLVDLAQVTPGARVLDAASGAGAILFPAAQRIGSQGRVVGIDLSRAMIERLRREVARRGLRNATVALMDAEALGFQDASFDFVLCGFALDSFPDPDHAMSEFRRVLRHGGHLGLTISSGWWWEGDERWRWHGELLRSLGVNVRAGSGRFATPDVVETDLKASGFVDISVPKETFDMVFANAGDWWQWAWSHGYRRVLEAMGREALERYRAACFEQLPHQSDADGIHGRLEVLLARATKRHSPSTT